MDKKGRWYFNIKNSLLKNIRILFLWNFVLNIIALFIIFSPVLAKLHGLSVNLQGQNELLALLFLGLVILFSLTISLITYFSSVSANKPDNDTDESMRALESDPAAEHDSLKRPVVLESELGRIDDSDYSRQILKLFRSAERLDTVEKDLARRLMEYNLIDRSAQKLLSEVQICTCRIIRQLTELHRNNQTGKKEEAPLNTPV
ncbi:MAG: hypothetical protein PHU88_00050 [candidate division Zixibacteria bacterium]|nr:hypothetical protein [candidate division Zixibacteria bacterium]